MQGNDQDQFFQELAKQQASLLNKLNQAQLWSDASKEDELLNVLQRCKKLKDAAFVPILIEHVTYEIRDKIRKTSLRTIEEACPVVDVLQEIGLPAVPRLIELLKREYPKEAKSDQTLIVGCLIGIYERPLEKGKRPAASGLPMARRRIELEVERSKGKEKLHLEDALKNYLFRD